jgi:hypothetical protein
MTSLLPDGEVCSVTRLAICMRSGIGTSNLPVMAHLASPYRALSARSGAGLCDSSGAHCSTRSQATRGR